MWTYHISCKRKASYSSFVINLLLLYLNLSRASASKASIPLSFGRDLRILKNNKNYLFLSLCFTFLYGVYTATGAVIAFITGYYDYTSADNSIFAAVFIITGVLASFVIGVILDKYSKYKMMLMFLAIGSVVTVGTSIFTLPSKSVFLFSLNIGLIGATIIPIIPVSYAFAVELTYPIPEAMSNGMMVMLS